jgi:hypothetical protein
MRPDRMATGTRLAATHDSQDASPEGNVMNESPRHDQKNEGEGNRTADRKYREGVERHVQSGASQQAADEAERALEGNEAEELRKAEEAGKAGRKTD